MSTTTRITIDQYAAMIERGDFEPAEDHRVELIRGEIVPKFPDGIIGPMNPPHAETVDELLAWSIESTPRAVVRLRVQGSISIPALDSVPEPDLVWLAAKKYGKQHPTPDDVLLLIEVADSSIDKDRGPKSELYAEAGIREYWIVDIQNRLIEVRRDPVGLTYRTVTIHGVDEEIRPMAYPESVLPVARIFEEE